MQRHFDEELRDLKEKILRMSSLVEEAICTSIKSLMDRNTELAKRVINSDDAINSLEIEIDNFSIKLLALRQPEAVDLRFITSVMKINNDLERIGDLAVNISELTLQLLKEPPLKSFVDLLKISGLVQDMLKDSVNAFVNNDSILAKKICERDNEVDNLDDNICKEAKSYMLKDSKNIESALNLILISGNLERIGDLATNICEDVIYISDGRVIKHHFEENK